MTISIEQMMECIENPVKTKLILTLQEKGTATPKELLKINQDIPKATLYRALKSMEAATIIEVVSEEKVRAMIEKTYALSKEFQQMGEEVVKDNDGEAYYKLFSAFMLGMLKKFERYAKSEEIDITKDGSSFTAVPIYATEEELAKYGQQIIDILTPAMTQSSAEQKMHTLATIVSPPIESE